MGAKHSFRTPNRGGGVSLFVCSLHSEWGSISSGFPSPFPALIVANFQSIGANFQQKGAKVRFYLLALVFHRDFRRPKTAKFKIYFNFEASVVLLSSSFVVAVVVSTECRLRGFRTCWMLAVVLWSSGGAFRPFCPLSRFACGALLANMALFRVLRAFWRGFSCSVWVCVAWVLCVACMAFVCVSG